MHEESSNDRRPRLSGRRRLRLVGIALALVGLLLVGSALRHRQPRSLNRPGAATVVTLPVPGLTGNASLRPTLGTSALGLRTVHVEVTAPTGASEMALSDDPTFGGVAWQPVAPAVDLHVARRGYVEIFGRFRVAGAPDFAPAVAGLVIDPPTSPNRGVTAIGMVRADVVAITIIDGRNSDGTIVGASNASVFDTSLNLKLSSTDDVQYATPTAASSLVRSTRPIDMSAAANDRQFVVEHRLFVTFPFALHEAGHYHLDLPGGVTADFVMDSRLLESPAVQVNQVGYAPNDPVKVALLSASLAGQGAIDFGDRTTFDVIDVSDAKVAFAGSPSKRGTPESGEYGRGDLTGAPVWELDFSPLSASGRYRVCVPSIGCSVAFAISSNGTWLTAAATVARAAFDQRSGMALGPPYTSVVRPRIQFPADGRSVQSSGLSLLQNGQGSNDTFKALVDQASTTKLADAWGGHMDAGDWDRRIQHLWYLRAGLDLVDLFPATFSKLNLDIPESGNSIPDVVDEGLWSLDLYMRMQVADGGVRGGIEAQAAPPEGGASWITNQKLYAYAPDAWSSYLFAGAAAEAAFSLSIVAPEQSARYLAAARKAAAWALAHPTPAEFHDMVESQRLVASAALYRATGEQTWQDEFLRNNPLASGPVDQLECHKHELCDAAWIYLRTDQRTRNEAVVTNAKESFRRTADSIVAAADTSRYRFGLDDPNVSLVWGLGPSTPKTTALIRAFVLFGDQKYWVQAARNGSYSLGANPLNTSFITGLGQINPRHPLVVDQGSGGLPVWPGIPVYGTHKVTEGKPGEGWFPQYFLAPAGTTPSVNDTPALWSWYDLPVFAAQNEYTLYQSHAAALFAFGALAALSSPPK